MQSTPEPYLCVHPLNRRKRRSSRSAVARSRTACCANICLKMSSNGQALVAEAAVDEAAIVAAAEGVVDAGAAEGTASAVGSAVSAHAVAAQGTALPVWLLA